MRGFILKLVAGNAIKLGLSYAYEVVVAVQAALQGVLDHGKVSDDVRRKISIAIQAVSAVSDFLKKVNDLIGVPVVKAELSSVLDIGHATDKLKKITDGL